MIRADLLLFDLDGTLADTKDDIATAVNLTLEAYGLPEKPREAIYGYIGDGVRKLLQRAFEDQPESRYDEALRVFRRHYLEHLLDTTRFYPGVVEVLDHFRGKKKAVATNKPFEYTHRILSGLGVLSHFDLVLSGDLVSGLKPDPAMLKEAIHRLDIPAGRCVMIGDGINDILAAKAAGVRSCAVGYGMGQRQVLLAQGPDLFCEKPGDLVHLLG